MRNDVSIYSLYEFFSTSNTSVAFVFAYLWPCRTICQLPPTHEFLLCILCGTAEHCDGNKDDTRKWLQLRMLSDNVRLRNDVSYSEIIFIFFVLFCSCLQTFCVHCVHCVAVQMTTTPPINSSTSVGTPCQWLKQEHWKRRHSPYFAKVNVIYVKKQCSCTACIWQKARAPQRIDECMPDKCDDTLKWSCGIFIPYSHLTLKISLLNSYLMFSSICICYVYIVRLSYIVQCDAHLEDFKRVFASSLWPNDTPPIFTAQ